MLQLACRRHGGWERRGRIGDVDQAGDSTGQRWNVCFGEVRSAGMEDRHTVGTYRALSQGLQ